MAKSLRSKWRRKCRAVKRERYGEKELARLKKTLGIDENAPVDSDMKEISDIATGKPSIERIALHFHFHFQHSTPLLEVEDVTM